MTVLDSFRLDGKVAVVTGGNRGLGRASAHALGEAGASVAIVARDAAASSTVINELTAAGGPGKRLGQPGVVLHDRVGAGGRRWLHAVLVAAALPRRGIVVE